MVQANQGKIKMGHLKNNHSISNPPEQFFVNSGHIVGDKKQIVMPNKLDSSGNVVKGTKRHLRHISDNPMNKPLAIKPGHTPKREDRFQINELHEFKNSESDISNLNSQKRIPNNCTDISSQPYDHSLKAKSGQKHMNNTKIENSLNNTLGLKKDNIYSEGGENREIYTHNDHLNMNNPSFQNYNLENSDNLISDYAQIMSNDVSMGQGHEFVTTPHQKLPTSFGSTNPNQKMSE